MRPDDAAKGWRAARARWQEGAHHEALSLLQAQLQLKPSRTASKDESTGAMLFLAEMCCRLRLPVQALDCLDRAGLGMGHLRQPRLCEELLRMRAGIILDAWLMRSPQFAPMVPEAAWSDVAAHTTMRLLEELLEETSADRPGQCGRSKPTVLATASALRSMAEWLPSGAAGTGDGAVCLARTWATAVCLGSVEPTAVPQSDLDATALDRPESAFLAYALLLAAQMAGQDEDLVFELSERYSEVAGRFARLRAQAREVVAIASSAAPRARALHSRWGSDIVDRAMEVLLNVPTTKISALAVQVGASERTLRDGFIREIGASPKAVQTALRLDAVKRCVDAGEHDGHSIEQIADIHGFSHPARLASAYKQRFRTSLNQGKTLRGAGEV